MSKEGREGGSGDARMIDLNDPVIQALKKEQERRDPGQEARRAKEAQDAAEVRDFEWADKQNREAQRQREREAKALESIETIFDEPDFNSIGSKLVQLKKLGVTELKAGDRAYDIDELRETLSEIRDNVDVYQDLDPANLDRALAFQGLTRAKLGENSKYGLRDAVGFAIRANSDARMMKKPKI